MKAVLIGFGYWGPNIARNLNNSKEFELYGICDISTEMLSKARSIYGDKIKYYTNYKEVIEDSAIDACAVALRNDIGQQVAREVLKAKKHLFMEKPMATQMQDALLLKQLADENDVIIHVDHILVFNPIVRRIKEILDSGELGDLIFFESNRANLGPHFKRDMSVMWDLAVHDLAILDYLCDGKEARKIECMGEKRFCDQEVVTYLNIKYDGFIAMIKSNWFSPLKERTIVVCGTKKMIVFDDLKDSEKLMIYDKGVEFDANSFNDYGEYEAHVRMGDLFVPYVEREDSLLNSVNHFAACIKKGIQSITGPDQAIRVLRILNDADKDLKGV